MRVFCRGLAETEDLWMDFEGERWEERERVEREEICDGILTLEGAAAICLGGRKWVGMRVEREREIDAAEMRAS